MSTVREEWGLACPECGSDEHIHVIVKTFKRLVPEGTTDDSKPCGDEEWDDDSFCFCAECDHGGTVRGFRVPEES